MYHKKPLHLFLTIIYYIYIIQILRLLAVCTVPNACNITWHLIMSYCSLRITEYNVHFVQHDDNRSKLFISLSLNVSLVKH